MAEKEREDSPMEDRAAHPRHVRLPGFLLDEEVGLGDFVKRFTSALGIKPCGGCAQRAVLLNQRLVFTGRRAR
jgi:hypothetical protein